MNSVAIVALILAVFVQAISSMSTDTAGDSKLFKAEKTIFNNSTKVASGSGSWTMYKQCDSQWAYQQLGTCALTICDAGCAMSSVAMMLDTKGCHYNPSTLDSWLTSNGGYADGCNIYWGSVDTFGCTTYIGKQNPTESEICNGLDAMHGLIANVNNGGHWVLLTGCAGGGVFYVNDPGYSRDTYSLSEIVEIAVYH